MKLYTLDNQFIREVKRIPDNFTGFVLHPDATKEWWANGKIHKEDGPACEYPDGSEYWVIKGQLHRLDGPACEYSNGNKEWWIHNTECTEEQHTLLVSLMKLKGLL